MKKEKRSGKLFQIGPKGMTIKVNVFECKECDVVLTFSADIRGVICAKCGKEMKKI